MLPITQGPPYLVGQDSVNLLQHLFLHIRVQGQLVGQVTQAVAGGLIASKNKDECLGQDLCVSQGCGEKGKAVLADGLSKDQAPGGGVEAGLLTLCSENVFITALPA